MEMKYYNASNNFKAPIPREPKPYRPPQPIKSEVLIPHAPEERMEKKEEPKAEEGLFETACENAAPVVSQGAAVTFDRDDYLLLGLILLLLASGCDDYLLLLVLGYLLIVGKKES